jgi:tetratricopeptide (TPR) repeat protein
MANNLLKTLSLALLFVFISTPAWAQVGRLRGVVLDTEGKPVRGAVLMIDRLDQNGNYEVKTNKKGQYIHAGLPLGDYGIRLLIDGEERDRVQGVRVSPANQAVVDFDLIAPEERATTNTPVDEEQLSSMSDSEREEYEAVLKERQAQMAENEALNSAFNTGMQALKAKNYPVAIESLKSAAEISLEQDVIWGNLGQAEADFALTKTGDEQAALMADAAISYTKAMEIAPTKTIYPNNLGLALMQSGQVDEGMTMLEKAVAIDPANGGQSYYNVGVVLSNRGDADGALAAFRKATEVQPDYAEAQYQYATALLSKATFADGAMVPVEGTVGAYQKYLELEPTGTFAESAKAMLASLAATVETTFKQ